MDLSLARFEESLARDARRDSLFGADKRAAVAAVLRFERDAPDVLLMKRAEREGDRWSGHVSFPGGREEAGDPDLLATAVRETREELGVDLAQSARLIGSMEPVRAIARGKVLGMSISPFVFVKTGELELELGDEAEDAFWLPLDRVVSGELDSVYPYRLGPARLDLPCWRFEGQVIWGLTHKMLSALLARL